MSWDGKDMYAVAQNSGNTTGQGNIARISMDGTEVENNLSGIASAHHDFTVFPGGIAMLLWSAPGVTNNSVVERASDGTLTTVLADLAAVYTPTASDGTVWFHPNSIHYHPWDDSYTIGDPYPRAYVKITRKGQLVWQFGGSNPKDPGKHIQVPAWSGENHGHHLLADGTFVFFNNVSTARVFKLDTASMTATSGLAYVPSTNVSSFALGDVQRLSNGNILVTYSTSGVIHEIDSAGKLVATFQVSQPGQFGYSEFRETLYGPPPY
jgi:hypothetical protein